MTTPDYIAPEDIEKIVDMVDAAPEFFTRSDGTRMAVMTADFYDMVKAVYNEHTVENVGPDHPIFDLPSNND
jgi:hypothetical protein